MLCSPRLQCSAQCSFSTWINSPLAIAYCTSLLAGCSSTAALLRCSPTGPGTRATEAECSFTCAQEPGRPKRKALAADSSSSDEEEESIASLNPAPPAWGAQKPNRNTFSHTSRFGLAPGVPHRGNGPAAVSSLPASGMGSRLSKHLKTQVPPSPAHLSVSFIL